MWGGSWNDGYPIMYTAMVSGCGALLLTGAALQSGVEGAVFAWGGLAGVCNCTFVGGGLIQEREGRYVTSNNGRFRHFDEDGEAASLMLLLRREMVWSEHSHHLFPERARARAVQLVQIGYLLSRQTQFADRAQAFMDIWRSFVMPLAITH